MLRHWETITGFQDRSRWQTQLAPSGFYVLFSVSQQDFATVLFFYYYYFLSYILEKKNQIFKHLNCRSRFRNNMYCANTCYATGPKPSPHMHAHKSSQSFQHNQVSLNYISPPYLWSLSWAMVSLCCKWGSEHHCPTLQPRAKPWGGSLQKMAPFSIVSNLLYS